MLTVAAFAAYRSPILRLAEVEVVGNKRLTYQRVVEVAGLQPGAPRWAHSQREIEARLRQEPWVLSVRARWNWNNLKIEVTERQPIGLLPYQGKWLALDETGMVLELVESPSARKLPVISCVPGSPALRGDQLRHPGLDQVLLVLSWMAEPLRAQVAEAFVDSEGWMTLYMVAGAQVQWGRVPEGKDRIAAVKAKIDRFFAFWQTVPREKMARCSIDLRVEPRVSATPSGCR